MSARSDGCAGSFPGGSSSWQRAALTGARPKCASASDSGSFELLCSGLIGVSAVSGRGGLRLVWVICPFGFSSGWAAREAGNWLCGVAGWGRAGPYQLRQGVSSHRHEACRGAHGCPVRARWSRPRSGRVRRSAAVVVVAARFVRGSGRSPGPLPGSGGKWLGGMEVSGAVLEPGWWPGFRWGRTRTGHFCGA